MMSQDKAVLDRSGEGGGDYCKKEVPGLISCNGEAAALTHTQREIGVLLLLLMCKGQKVKWLALLQSELLQSLFSRASDLIS